jgi:hypothetical protein
MHKHPHIEDAYALRITDLLAAHEAGARSVSLRKPPLPWLAGSAEQEATFKLNLNGTTGNVELTHATGELGLASDSIALEATQPSFGGVRWWFRCGVTGRRASKLFLFPDQRRFCHRAGLGVSPTYLSQRVSGVDKVWMRLWSLRQSIPGQGTILEPLKRPPRMHLATYVKLLQRDAAIWNSPDNEALSFLRAWGMVDGRCDKAASPCGSSN